MNPQTQTHFTSGHLEAPTSAANTAANDYQTPAIEAVITLEELEREVHYAGSPSGLQQF